MDMKTYDFTSKEREFGRVVFALTLDKKRMMERIIIGKSHDVKRRLEQMDVEGIASDIYFEETRPLGSLLLHFESDINGDWNKNILPLRESYTKIFPRQSARWKMVAPVQNFLTEKYNSGEPSAMFSAIRTWEDYLNCFSKNHGADLLGDNLQMLYKPFRVYGKYKPWQEEATTALSVALHDGESQVELWYPVAKRPFETVVAFSSFLPIISYYRHKISEWGFIFSQCKVCDNFFLARSKHYELCSDKCRKKKATTAKKEFDERAKGDRIGQLYDGAYQYWYNRWRKLKKGKTANEEMAVAFKVHLDNFCKEAKRRKESARRRELSIADFSSWLAQQQNEADRLMDEYQKRHEP